LGHIYKEPIREKSPFDEKCESMRSSMQSKEKDKVKLLSININTATTPTG